MVATRRSCVTAPARVCYGVTVATFDSARVAAAASEVADHLLRTGSTFEHEVIRGFPFILWCGCPTCSV